MKVEMMMMMIGNISWPGNFVNVLLRTERKSKLVKPLVIAFVRGHNQTKSTVNMMFENTEQNISNLGGILKQLNLREDANILLRTLLWGWERAPSTLAKAGHWILKRRDWHFSVEESKSDKNLN